MIGQQISHYHIRAMLGKGRIGTVYQAIDLDKQMPVALKVIAEQLGQKPEFRQRFLREVRLLPRLEHPSIVAIEEVGVDRERDLLYMVTQYVTGGTLTAYLQQLSWQDKVMRPGEALLITAQVAEALDYAHEKGVLHRDIRPNIILFREEEEWRESEEMHRRAVISDFGIASLLEIEKEPLLQSLQYMSPEQCLGKELDGRSDLYSLGVLLYQITVGRLPFAISSAKEAVEKHAYEDPPPPRQIKADLPLAVENVILTAIAKRPQDRFQTGAEMAEVLRQTVAALPQALAVLAPEEGEHEVDTVAALPAGIGQGIVNEDQVTITQEMPHRLSRRIITIGRSESNDIVLAAPTVTRRHAQLERTAAGWQVRDLGSQNGTYLDDAPLLPDIPVRWHSHQTLRIGPYFLQLKEGKGFTYQAHALDVDVTPNEIEVPAGQARVLRVAVRNLTAEEQEFALTMERVPPEWVVLPAEPMQLEPGMQLTVDVTVQPPDDAVVGKDRYLMMVHPLAAEHDRVTIPGVVHILPPEDSFSLALQPLRIRGREAHQLTVRNEGKKEQTYLITDSASHDGTLRFGEWRVATPSTNGEPARKVTTARAGGGSRLSALTKLPPIRRITYAPKAIARRVGNAPRHALNRIMPGLGNLLGAGTPGKFAAPTLRPGRQEPARGRGSGLGHLPAPQLEKVIYPEGLQTQVVVSPGEQREVYLAIEPRARLLLAREDRIMPYELEVRTPAGAQQSIGGQLEVRPRIRSRIPGWALVLLLFFLCTASTLFYLIQSDQTLAAYFTSSTDIDGDGLTNMAEVYVHETDPRDADSDGDGVSDGDEIALALDPHVADTDGDGLSDGRELALKTAPLDPDTDGDRLADGLEVNSLHTDPLDGNAALSWALPTPTPTHTPAPTATLLPQPSATPAPAATRVTLTGPGEGDGYLGQDGDVSGVAVSSGEDMWLGDGANGDRQFKVVVSIDTSSIPENAVLEGAQLRLRRSGVIGSPYTLGEVHVDVSGPAGFAGSSMLETADFIAPATVANAAVLSRAAADGDWVEGSLNEEALQALNRQGITQFRLYFTLPNNGDGADDWLLLAAAEQADEDDRPQLIVTYALPEP